MNKQLTYEQWRRLVIAKAKKNLGSDRVCVDDIDLLWERKYSVSKAAMLIADNTVYWRGHW
jgi:hypothetical protein